MSFAGRAPSLSPWHELMAAEVNFVDKHPLCPKRRYGIGEWPAPDRGGGDTSP